MAQINRSVGSKGVNARADVRTVQQLLNKHAGKLGFRPLSVDGLIGPKTIGAIREFQTKVTGLARPDGLIEVGKTTWRSLAGGAGGPGSGGGSPAAPGAKQPTASPAPSRPRAPVAGTVTISGKTLAQPAHDVLTQILQNAGLSSAYVTSVERTAKDQARVMYANCKNKGIAAQYKVYGSNGDKVVKVYEDNHATKSEMEVRNLMEAKINAIGPSRVSRHCSNTHYVFDISEGSIANWQAFRSAAKKHPAVSNMIDETSTNDCFHLEIPRNSPHLP